MIKLCILFSFVFFFPLKITLLFDSEFWITDWCSLHFGHIFLFRVNIMWTTSIYNDLATQFIPVALPDGHHKIAIKIRNKNENVMKISILLTITNTNASTLNIGIIIQTSIWSSNVNLRLKTMQPFCLCVFCFNCNVAVGVTTL